MKEVAKLGLESRYFQSVALSKNHFTLHLYKYVLLESVQD